MHLVLNVITALRRTERGFPCLRSDARTRIMCLPLWMITVRSPVGAGGRHL